MILQNIWYFRRITEDSFRRITEDGNYRGMEDIVLAFTCTPRSTTFNTLLFISETTGTSFTATIRETTINDNDVEISYTVADLPKDCYYRILIKQNNTEVWRGKLFVSARSIIPYSMNYNDYISHTSNNEFITI